MSGRFKSLLAVFALFSFAASSFAAGDDRFTYFDRIAKLLERRNDAAGAALMREFGEGDPIVPRVLSEGAVSSHPDLAERYGALQKSIKHLIVSRSYAPEHASRIFRAEAALDFVAYELEQFKNASERDVLTYLSDAQRSLKGMTRGAPPASADEPDSFVDAPVAAPPTKTEPPPVPRVSLMLSSPRIISGAATWLKWNAQNAKTVELDGERVNSEGHRLVRPTESRRYQIIARGPDTGVASAVVTVTVLPPPVQKTPPPVRAPEVIPVSVPPARTTAFMPDRFTISSTAPPLDPSSLLMIERLVDVLRLDTSLRVRIESHTDTPGFAASNLKTSRKNAAALRDFIVRTYRIAARRFDVIGKGESDPVSNQNRRTEFFLIRPR